MNRINKKFKELKRNNRSGFIPFIVAGDPDLETSKKLILELAAQDASVIELGIPFSDPVADGVTIQAAAERALINSISVQAILNLVGEIRKEGCETPIILFSYFNPILRFGLQKFADEARKSGVDGILITDLIAEEADEFHKILTENDLCLIMLTAPTSSDERLKKICEKASGFVYAISRAGVTGAKTDLSAEAKNLVARIRGFTELPVAVGFGVTNNEQIREVCEYADAAVVGSAIVAEIERSLSSGATVENVSQFVKKLLDG